MIRATSGEARIDFFFLVDSPYDAPDSRTLSECDHWRGCRPLPLALGSFSFSMSRRHACRLQRHDACAACDSLAEAMSFYCTLHVVGDVCLRASTSQVCLAPLFPFRFLTEPSCRVVRCRWYAAHVRGRAFQRPLVGLSNLQTALAFGIAVGVYSLASAKNALIQGTQSLLQPRMLLPFDRHGQRVSSNVCCG